MCCEWGEKELKNEVSTVKGGGDKRKNKVQDKGRRRNVGKVVQWGRHLFRYDTEEEVENKREVEGENVAGDRRRKKAQKIERRWMWRQEE